jgi:SAGA-associated factor 29
MAARSRPRGGVSKDDAGDAGEERNLWSGIVSDLKRIKAINAKAAEISRQIIEEEAAIGSDNCMHSHILLGYLNN